MAYLCCCSFVCLFLLFLPATTFRVAYLTPILCFFQTLHFVHLTHVDDLVLSLDTTFHMLYTDIAFLPSTIFHLVCTDIAFPPNSIIISFILEGCCIFTKCISFTSRRYAYCVSANTTFYPPETATVLSPNTIFRSPLTDILFLTDISFQYLA